jgi:hypothetical protein
MFYLNIILYFGINHQLLQSEEIDEKSVKLIDNN